MYWFFYWQDCGYPHVAIYQLTAADSDKILQGCQMQVAQRHNQQSKTNLQTEYVS